MMITIELNEQQFALLCEIFGNVSMPMKLTLPLMKHIEDQVNAQRQAQMPKSNGHDEVSKELNG